MIQKDHVLIQGLLVIPIRILKLVIKAVPIIHSLKINEVLKLSDKKYREKSQHLYQKDNFI